MFKKGFGANGSYYVFAGNEYVSSTIKEIQIAESHRRYYQDLGDVDSTRFFESSIKSKLRHLTYFGELKKLY